LKRREFALDPSITRFRLSEPLRRPVLTAEPSIYTRALHPQDKFIIFASDGLWEHLTNQQAVEIVHSNPRRVCIWYIHLHVHQSIFCHWSLGKGLSGNS
jgi:pyruvate dehydrogenase phosphatase